MIKVEQIGIKKRLAPLSFELAAGSITHVIGANGSGKSSLLAALAGETSCSGKIWSQANQCYFSSLSPSELASIRGYLPQNQSFYFNLTVIEFLALFLLKRENKSNQADEMLSMQSSWQDQQIKEICDELDIRHLLRAKILNLSGGEFQRVKIVATVLQIHPKLNPKGQLLILDEPAAPLDISQQQRFYLFLEKLAQTGLAIILANHDLNKASHFADQVILLKQGGLVTMGHPSEVMKPDRLFTCFETQILTTKIKGQDYWLFP